MVVVVGEILVAVGVVVVEVLVAAAAVVVVAVVVVAAVDLHAHQLLSLFIFLLQTAYILSLVIPNT